LVEPHAARKHISVQTSLQLKEPVRLDAFKIRQIALNLLLNAIQTSPPGGNVIFLCETIDDTLTLTIEDDGPGLPAYARDFLLAENPQPSDHSIGLETVRRLSRELGGQISLSEHLPTGSTITLRFDIGKA